MRASTSKTAGNHSIFPTAPPKSDTSQTARLKICIASPEFTGVTPAATTGMAFTAMAQALAAAGHMVTCLFLGAKTPSPEAWQIWVDKYKKDGLILVALPAINASDLVAPVNLIKSYETYQWLKKNDRFDIIHFPERQGPGYHTLMAKHHNLAFAQTTICVGLHSMTAWLKSSNETPASDLAEVDTDFMERRVVAMADAVVSPSHYLLNWISEQKWEMPRNCYVQQNILPHSALPAEPPVAPHLHEINELVYFGPLESRKGIVLFCDGLDCVPSNILQKIRQVTFLGRESIIEGVPSRNYVEKRAKNWAFPIQITTDQDGGGTMNYLRRNNRLAVIPSLLENSPYRVLECLVGKIAFVASSVGGIPELIAPADIGKVCFEPNVGALCAILCSALTEGVRPASAAVDARTTDQAWVALHETSLFKHFPPVQPAHDALAPAVRNLSDEATQSAIHALSVDPANAIALKALARIHLNAGLYEAAQEACHLILKNTPGDAEAAQMLNEATIIEATLAENILDSQILDRLRADAPLPEKIQAFIPGFAATFALP